MSADSCQNLDNTEDNKLVRPKVELQSLLQNAGAQQEVFTMKELMHYLGQYIMQRKLYDQRQQHIVHCSQDALGQVLGVDSFSVKEPRVLFAMITKNIIAVKTQDSPPHYTEQLSQPERGPVTALEAVESTSVSSSSEKRRRRRRRSSDPGPSRSADEEDEEEEEEEEEEDEGGRRRKRRRSDSYSLTFDNSLSWCVIGGLGNGRDRHSSQSSDSHSVSNPGASSVPLVDGSDSDSDNFSVEFEVESIDSEDYDEETSLSGEDEVYEVTIFEADDEDSFDEDTEITEADYWKCGQCGELNPPLPRNCNRCWALRQDWLPDVSVNRSSSTSSQTKALPPKPPADQSASADNNGLDPEDVEGLDLPDGKRLSAQCEVSQDLLLSSQTLPSSSQELESSPPSQASPVRPSSSRLSSPLPELEKLNSSEMRLPESCLEPCVICQSAPKNGCIVHGRTGHLMACYCCARKLKRRNKLCPVCREPIQAVVLTYFS